MKQPDRYFKALCALEGLRLDDIAREFNNAEIHVTIQWLMAQTNPDRCIEMTGTLARQLFVICE